MNSAIDAPKSKTITIAFIALKAMSMGIVITSAFQQLGGDCSNNLKQIATLFKIFFILNCLLDAFSLCLFYCTERFSRLQYYVFFVFHCIFALFALITGIIWLKNGNDCSIKNPFMGGCLLINLVFIVSAVIIMWCNLYFGLKYAHLGCNIVWTFMWIFDTNCHHTVVAIIACIHGILSIAGLVSFIVISIIKKNSITASCWRALYTISIVLMIICYIMALIAIPSTRSCPGSHFFIKSYTYYGWIEVISPILLLMFLHTEMGDPREAMMKKDAKVFLKKRQNENFIVDDVN